MAIKPKLSHADWTEIYYALEFKRDHSPAVSGDKRWIKHLNSILRKIGPDGDDAYALYRHTEEIGFQLSRLTDIARMDIFTDSHEYASRVEAVAYFALEAQKVLDRFPRKFTAEIPQADDEEAS